MSREPKVRKYAHFDDPLDKDVLAAFAITPEEVSSHPFLPLLGYEKIARKMDFDDGFPFLVKKPRAIRYASHTDAAIYSQYAQALNALYDADLKARGLSHSVLAYRSGIGNNIHFAKSLFDEIKERENCIVVCIDISKFFDNLRHEILKKNLCQLLGVNRLPSDWFKVFERLTSYEYVSKEDIEAKLGRLRGKRVCSIDVFRSYIRPLIKRHDKSYGIPQGTPLSGTFANLYMVEFDSHIRAILEGFGGTYRRYSDDIAIVLPSSAYLTEAMSAISDCLDKHGLALNEDKTCVTAVTAVDLGQQTQGDECQYLGFTYDGRRVLIRSASMKNYYSRMKRGINKYVKGAAHKKVPPLQIRKRVPIGRFTHWGDNKNFVQYAYRAAKLMNSPAIKRQLRNHVEVFNRSWVKSLGKWYPDQPG